MFTNAKLRLLMALVKLERLGVEDVPGASWVVPSSLNSNHLRATKAVIDRCLDSPMVGDLQNDPREMLRRKYPNENNGNTRQVALDVNFGSDSEGEDVPDGPLFPPNPRSKAQALSELKKKREKQNKDDEQAPPDDETLEARRQARLENSRARLAKIKSNLYVHASDEDTDEGADEQFFLLEEKRRKEQAERVRKALLTGAVPEMGGRKKRQKEQSASSTPGKRQRRADKTSLSDADDGEDILMDDDLQFDDDLAFSRNRNPGQVSSHDQIQERDSLEPDGEAVAHSNDEADAPTPPPARRRIRAGFVIDSDSE